VLATSLGEAKGGVAVATAVAVTLSRQHAPVLLVELDPAPSRGPTMLAAAGARDLEDALRQEAFERVAARGRLCWLGLEADAGALGELMRAIDALPGGGLAVAHMPPLLWPAAIDHRNLPDPGGALLRADLSRDRSLAALTVIELRDRRIRARVASRPLGRVATRRALAGLEPGGSTSQRVARLATGLAPRGRNVPPPAERPLHLGALAAERGQALIMVLAAAFAILFCAAVLTAIGGAVTGMSRTQRAADLAALSGARSLRDDFERLFVPAELASGAPNPQHLDKDEYLERAAAAARDAAVHNGVDPGHVRVTFPDRESFAPTLVKASVTASLDKAALPGGGGAIRGKHAGVRIQASAKAEASVPATGPAPTMASGGGYSGPLAYRQGKPMRPDVAAAFDRMAAAAQRDGISLVINSAFRSDAEQARLWAANPDPRWVAPPGTSLHRCATELDLGPPSATGWLAAHAGQFHFLQRYSWEPWHFGFTGGPPPCSDAGDRVGMPAGHGEPEPTSGLQSFVPGQYRDPILRSAARWNVSAGLLAAQLMAESNFNPFAVSPAGAQGIAQFMPGTAALYGLDDPFDAPAAIDAQAHLMADLLGQFGGSVSLALAAYNAGPGAVEACDCVPSIPETEAYVARILGLMGGAGELVAPRLEVRLVA
jgi:hypothetical protein